MRARIERLSHVIKPETRAELQQLVVLLEQPRNQGPIVLAAFSRMCMQFMRQVYASAGESIPSDNLFDCLVKASGGDSDKKVKGLRIIPDEIINGLHTVRTLANKANHDAATVELNSSDAVNALGLYLRALEWYYFESQLGPKTPPPAIVANRRRLHIGLVVTLLGSILLVVGVIISASKTPRERAAPTASETRESQESTFPSSPIPEMPVNLPANELLKLLATGKAPASPGEKPPKLTLSLSVRRGNTGEFSAIRDGESLVSRRDQYLILARSETSGYLYVVQVDSLGKVAWLWPRNNTCKFSTGVNPIKPGTVAQIPPKERFSALVLDDNVGHEHIYFVFSAARWPELEGALNARQDHLVGQKVDRILIVQRGIEVRGIGDEVPLDGVPKEPKQNPIAAEILTANGGTMVECRWFRHVNP